MHVFTMAMTLALLSPGMLAAGSEEPTLRPGPGFESKKIGDVSLEKDGVVELGKHSNLGAGDGRIVYHDGTAGVLGEIDKTLKVRVLAKFKDSEEELRALLAKQEDKQTGEIESAKILPLAMAMRVANRRVYLLQELDSPDSKAVRLVQAIKDGKVEWTWFVRAQESGDLRDRLEFDVNEEGTEIALVEMGKGDSFSVYDRKKGRVAAFKFVRPGEEISPVKPQDKDDYEIKHSSPDVKRILEEHRQIMIELEKEKEKELEKSGKKEVPAPAPTKVDWSMGRIHLLRFLPDDTYLVAGTDKGRVTVVWLKKDGTVKLGLKKSDLGGNCVFAGVIGGNPVFFDEHALTIRVVGPDLVANEIAGLGLDKKYAYVLALDADTLVLDRGHGLTAELLSIKKKEEKK